MGNAPPSCIAGVALCPFVLCSCLDLLRQNWTSAVEALREYPCLRFGLGLFLMDVTFSVFPEFHQWSMDVGEATMDICRILIRTLWVGCRYTFHWIVEHPSYAISAFFLTAWFGEDVWILCKDVNHLISRFFRSRRSF